MEGLGCRSCFVSSSERANLDYDIERQGRTHSQTVAMRQELRIIAERSKVQAEDYATRFGLLLEEPPLTIIAPALDLILSRPSDSAHSELQGVTKQMHFLMIERILF